MSRTGRDGREWQIGSPNRPAHPSAAAPPRRKHRGGQGVAALARGRTAHPSRGPGRGGVGRGATACGLRAAFQRPRRPGWAVPWLCHAMAVLPVGRAGAPLAPLARPRQIVKACLLLTLQTQPATRPAQASPRPTPRRKELAATPRVRPAPPPDSASRFDAIPHAYTGRTPDLTLSTR